MRLPGIGGSLFPGHFLATRFAADTLTSSDRDQLYARRRHFVRWWQQVDATCGPATGLRALFDLVAMPLAGMLGFRAHDALFEDDLVRVTLTGPGPARVPLTLLRWAERASRRSRDLLRSSPGDSDWCFILAPPFLSLVDARGHAFRRMADFRLPSALDDRSFPAFWTLCRATSLVTNAGAALVHEAGRFQDAVRRDLQSGVVEAVGLLAPVLGRQNRTDDRFAEALTLIYRALFLLFAESRAVGPIHHARFHHVYTMTALCREAARSGTQAGIWDGLAAITRLSRSGCATSDLIVRPFNGRLFSRAAAPALEAVAGTRPTRQSAARDAALSTALVALATRKGPGGRETISYADLGVEQLGAVYERVLDVDPESVNRPPFKRDRSAESRQHSSRRKESGTFYTPSSLAECVIRRTLGPLVRGRTTSEILQLRIVDPAMGSGAFLVAACRYLSDAYEKALIDESGVADTDLDSDSRSGIRRLVASRCLAGVDINPVAVQLARLSLWLTTVARDKPLSFFDHQLRCGNSLVGASPDDLWRVQDRQRARPSTTPLFEAAGLETAIRAIVNPWRLLRAGTDDTIGDVRTRERLWKAIDGEHSPLLPWRTACDLWCSRWFRGGDSREPAPAEVRAAIDGILRKDKSLGRTRMEDLLSASRRAEKQHRFFHWPLEFADLFYDPDGAPRNKPGFDAVIGNPPWEMLRGADPARRELVSFVRESGLYPSCDRGHVNLYQPFLERSLSLVRPGGRVGLVLPWGLASDDGAAALRGRLFERERVDTVIGLDNAGGLFPIHRGLRFMALTVERGGEPRPIRAKFGVRTGDELDELPGVEDPEIPSPFPVRIDLKLLRNIGGGTLRIPDVRGPDDLAWLTAVCQRFPPLGSGWKVSFGRELNATEDRDCFGSRGLPVLDGKHISPYCADVAGASARVADAEIRRRLPAGTYLRPRLAYRDVSGVGNRLTLIAAIIPAGTVTTHTLFCLRQALAVEQQHFLCALFNSRPLNRLVRLLMGSHVTTGLVEHLPVPPWTGARDQIRLAELSQRMASISSSSEIDVNEIQREIDARVGRLYNSAGG